MKVKKITEGYVEQIFDTDKLKVVSEKFVVNDDGVSPVFLIGNEDDGKLFFRLGNDIEDELCEKLEFPITLQWVTK